jgi:hypothetical protein
MQLGISLRHLVEKIDGAYQIADNEQLMLNYYANANVHHFGPEDQKY